MKKSHKLLAAVLSATMLLSATATALPANATQADSNSAISYFKNPDYTAKPMARMWFPDATAGIDDNDVIEKQINSLAEAGFGGVEIAMLSDSTSYTNDQAEYCGWGSDSWVKLLKKVYKAANAIEGGFVVDLTITAHWPPCVNTIDPNDPQTSKQTAVSFTPVTAEDIQNGSVELKLPETKTTDGKNAHFIFTDTLVSTNLAKVVSVTDKEEKGTPYTEYNLDFSSLKGMDASEIEGKTTPAGIPDKAYAESQGWDYQETLDAFGPEQADPNETAKVDVDGNRKRMADEQHYYQADLSGLTADDVSDGNYVLVSVYYRGTGQLFNGGSSVVMHNRCYVMDFFNDDGINAITDYWDNYILNDTELAAMIRENGGSIFEDSIEANKTTNLWAPDLKEEIAAYYGENYQYQDVIAAVVASERTYGGFGASADPKDLVYTYDNEEEKELGARIVEDYNDIMGHLYETQHCIPANKWAESIGCNYRAQTYDLTGLDIAGAASTVTIPEGDNMTKGDGLRQLSASANLYNKKYLSMEAITGASIYQFNWEDILFELTANFSWGVNRAIFHGSAYSKSINGFHADWPGWDPFGGSFGEPYTYRQAYWDEMDMVTDYVSRNQALLQYANQKVDVAVVRDGTLAFKNPSGNSMQALLDHGYSYNIMSEALINGENAHDVQNQMIYPDGPGYKALVLSEVSTISVESMETILDYAKAGIPIISYSSNPSKVYGTEKSDNMDAKVQELYQELLTFDNVKETSNKDEIPEILKSLGIIGYANYSIPKLETTMYQDTTDGTNYYYMFNDVSTFQGMLTAGSSKIYKTGEYGEAIQDAIVTLEGSGTPYMLDAMTGEITQIGEYTDNGDGTITLCLDNLDPGASTIIAITNNTTDFPAPSDYVTDVNADNGDYEIARDVDHNAVFRSNTAGSYQVSLSDGTTKDVTIDKSGEVLDLSDAKWNLTIDSYGPKYKDASSMVDPETGIQTVDPSETEIITVDFGEQNLVNWADIQATEEQLATLGVASMDNVSGRGYYTTTFDWDGSKANLWMSYGNDQITGITINGQEIDVINNLTDTVDLGKYLIEGSNTLTIELTTTLNKRARVESDVFAGGGGGPSFGGEPITDNGLVSAILTPYTEVVLADQEQADKGILNAVISYANAAKESGEYDNAIESVQKSFDEALTNAKSVAENDAATQEEVDAAWKTLLNEIHKLGFVAGDKTELASLIAAAEEIDLSKYVEAGQVEFTAALEAAQSVYKDGDAMQAEINEVADKLLNAMLNLRYKADKSILEEVVAKANQIDANVYTAESYAVLTAALKDANAVLANENATQEEVDVAVQSVQAAMDSLVAVEGTETPSDNNATQTGQESTTTKANAAKTGDFAPIAGLAVLAVAGAAILITRKKK